MQIEVVFRNVTPADTLKSYALKRFSKVARMLDGKPDTSLLITLSAEKNKFRTDARLEGSGLNFTASEANDDMYASIDLCNDRLGQQLRKASERRSAVQRDSVKDFATE